MPSNQYKEERLAFTDEQIKTVVNKDKTDALLRMIWENEYLILERVLKMKERRSKLRILDPNMISGTPALSIAKMFNRKRCLQLLSTHHADEAYARKFDVFQSYSLFFEKYSNTQVRKKLADQSEVVVSIDDENIFPSYAAYLVNEGLKNYLSKNKQSHHKIKKSIDILNFASKNFFSNTTFKGESILANIKKGKTTFINSGWQGESPGDLNHVIGIIFHQGCIIIGDGLKERVKIYRVRNKHINQEVLNELISCPIGSDGHNEIIYRITHGEKPLASIHVKTQKHLNCAVFSLLSAMQGLWYVMERDKGSSQKAAAHQAQTLRDGFTDFMKSRIKKQIRELKENYSDIVVQKTNKKNTHVTPVQQANWYGLAAAALIYVGMSYMMNVLLSSFIAGSAIAAYWLVFMITKRRMEHIHNQKMHFTKNPRCIKKMSQSQIAALQVGLAANKSNVSLLTSWASPAAYYHSSEYYMGLGLSPHQRNKVHNEIKRMKRCP